MPLCKNCPEDKKCYYTGKENNPRGKGYSAKYEPEGKRMQGRDKKMYVVKNGRWVKSVLKKKTSPRMYDDPENESRNYKRYADLDKIANYRFKMEEWNNSYILGLFLMNYCNEHPEKICPDGNSIWVLAKLMHNENDLEYVKYLLENNSFNEVIMIMEYLNQHPHMDYPEPNDNFKRKVKQFHDDLDAVSLMILNGELD